MQCPALCRDRLPDRGLVARFPQRRRALQPLAGRIFEAQAKWLETLFAAIGLSGREPANAAWAILTAIQGGIGLAHATASETPFLAAIADARGRVADLLSRQQRALS